MALKKKTSTKTPLKSKKTTHQLSKTAKAKPAATKKTPVKVAAAGSLAMSLLGKKAPAFKTGATSGFDFDSKDLKGQNYVLYFYPKDNTPGCTLEGQDFRRLMADFKRAKCQIFGVSKDSLKSHESFKSKCDFPFELLLDEDEAICRKFDVIQMKKLYGREYQGIERSTFLVDAEGVVRGEWRKVKVDGHAQAVLDALKSVS